MRDLKAIRADCLVLRGSDGSLSQAELNSVLGQSDEFDRQSLALVRRLTEVTQNVGRVRELRLQAADVNGGKSLVVIRLEAENRAELKQLQDMLQKMKTLKSASSWPADLAKLREKKLQLLDTEIRLQISHNSSSCTLAEGPSSMSIEMQEAKRRAQLQRKRDARKSRRFRLNSNPNLDEKHSELDKDLELNKDLELVPITVSADAKVQEFIRDSSLRTAEENDMLDELKRGVEELGEIARNMNVSISVGNAMATDLEHKVNQRSEQFKSANKQIDQLREEDNGLGRWLPICVCATILVVLLLYLARTLST